MRNRPLFAWAALALSGSFWLSAQSAPSVNTLRDSLRGLRQVPEAQRGTRTGEIAREIASLPAGMDKLKLANGLAHLATEGDAGRENLQAVTDALAGAVSGTDLPPSPDGKPADPYRTLASLAHYEKMQVAGPVAEAPQYKTALAELVAEDEDAGKLDFAVTDLHGKKWVKSDLAGKVVLLNFWATWCPPCRQELPNLDAIAAHYAPAGLVVLALTDEDAAKVNNMFRGIDPHFTIALDKDRKVANTFHVAGIPRTYAFDRNGKLAAVAEDARTQKQFLLMLRQAGLQL